MNERFGHSYAVHFIGVGGPLFLARLAYRSSVDHFVVGGIALRIGLVAACVLLAVAVLVLYLRSGIQRYEVAESGLVIRRPWSRVVVPWQDIRHIDWNRPLHYVVVRGESSIIAFTSTDGFPRILDLIRVVHERSSCTLPAHLERLLSSNTRD